MLDSEKLNIFDSSRPELQPYGFTVEKWTPRLMPKPDRHNEIEINLLTSGSITYLMYDRIVKIKPKRLVVFWALIPHQIIQFDNEEPYYVCTIPFAQFMNWQLPSVLVDPVLKEEVVYALSAEDYQYDKYLMELWLKDREGKSDEHIGVSIMEMRARLHRFGLNSIPVEGESYRDGEYEITRGDMVENMIIYIARNYKKPLKNKDIGTAVGLHPDYANTIFKKSIGMTLNQYVLQQRILYARRQLSVSDDSITEIAYEAGFNSLSRFNAAFKEKCNCSPRAYRKKHFRLRS